MPKLNSAIIAVLICAGIAVPALIQSRSQAKLRQETEVLRERANQLARLPAENERLSNLLIQLRLAQVDALAQFKELVQLRSEVKQLKLDNEQSNLVAQASVEDRLNEVARLKAEVSRLNEENKEIDAMREEIRQLRADAAVPLVAQTAQAQPAPSEPAAAEEQPLTIRMINTQGEAFAEKLKRSVGAADNETFQQVFGRFLQANGVRTDALAAAVYSERTGRVIVRGTEATLDQVEKLTQALDQAQ